MAAALQICKSLRLLHNRKKESALHAVYIIYEEDMEYVYL